MTNWREDTPPRYARWVWRLAQTRQVVLWNGLTGLHAAVSLETAADLEQGDPYSAPPHLTAVMRRLSALHLLATDPLPDRWSLRPARNRRVLLFPGVGLLWTPLPALRTPGGFPYGARSLTPEQVRFWQTFNGVRTLDEAMGLARISPEDALALCATLTHPAVQALQLRPQPSRARDPGLLQLVAPERPPAPREPDMRGADGETSLAAWHAHSIRDGRRHFDDRETTISHTFGLPHPALGERSYGACLYDALCARGWLPQRLRTTLEIGPGDGELGAAWRACVGSSGEHIRLDLSPVLLATQRVRQPGTREILGSATDIPLPARSVDLILCNEVIADLTAVPLDVAAASEEGGAAVAAVRERLLRYQISPLGEGVAMYNLGAWQVIEEVARILAPGGVAFLTEFGDIDEIPQETAHLDHPEVSIHFGHLVRIAEANGLEAELLPLTELLGADLQARWLSRHSYEALRAWTHARGEHLEARAWTPQTLPLSETVEGIEWVPITDHGPGPLITRFPALLLRRPCHSPQGASGADF